MNELRRGAGTQWNPKVVEAALTALAGAPAEIQDAEAQRKQPSPAMA
jgi:HD-GYP domain-containing protein (c-di-GMP phosphodiesterase class II)